MSPKPLHKLSARRRRYRSILKQRRSHKRTVPVFAVFVMIVIAIGFALRSLSGPGEPSSIENNSVRTHTITATSDRLHETVVLQESPERYRTARA
jgi:hypothetical protein